MRRLDQVAGLGVLVVYRHHRHITAPFDGRLSTPLAGEEVLHGGEQEAAESSACGVGCAQVVFLEQLGEERLGEVAGVLDLISASTHIGVQRIPVVRAQRGERAAGLRGWTGAGLWC